MYMIIIAVFRSASFILPFYPMDSESSEPLAYDYPGGKPLQ